MKAIFFNRGRMINAALKALPATLLMAGMASCSDDNTFAEPGTDGISQSAGLETSPLSVITDPAKMPARVLNYSFGTPGSRSLNPEIDLNAYLQNVQNNVDLSKLVELKDANFYYNPDQLDFSQLVVSGDYKGALQNFGSTVYVTGKWTITGFNANTYLNEQATIVVLPGNEKNCVKQYMPPD